MKAALSVLVFFGLGLFAAAAEGSSAATVVPQPRIRLQLTSAGTAIRVESAAAGTAETTPESPAMMEKLVVTGTKVRATPRPFVPEDRTSFSFLKGGPLVKKNLGGATLEIGMWTWVDIFAEDARFKGAPARAQFDFVRLKW